MSTTSATSAARKPLPARHEAFCRHLADGCSQAEAARRAGYPPVSSKQRGSELYARTEIQTRLGQLMAERADEMTALRQRTLARMEVIHDKAVETDRVSLAFRVLLAIARIGGLNGVTVRQARTRVEKAQVENRVENRVENWMEDWMEAQFGPEPAPQAAPGPAPARTAARPAPNLPPQLASALDAVLGRSSPRSSRAGMLGDLPLPGLLQRFA